MPFGRDEEEEENDTLFDDVSAMADRLHLTGDKRSNYIDDHMTAAGYERIQSRESYARVREQDEDDDDSGSSRWFGKPKDQGRDRGQRASSSRNRRDDDDRF